MAGLAIVEIIPDDEAIAALAAIHIEAVADNAGMSFVHPLTPEKATAFWRQWLARTEAGRQIVFGAFDAQGLEGSVTLLLDMPENQPHRAEIAKMMVAKRAQRRGIATRLLAAAENAARKHSRTLLMLDTATGSAASRLYDRLGWIRFGDVPGHALLPNGEMRTTSFYYKQLG
jgi:GNAT superfamily N-acetyltransferase